MKLSIIIPAYNEEKTVLELVKRVESVALGKIKKELIIVDDFSTDSTRDILTRIKNAKIFFHSRNQGKGAAIRTGLKHVTGDLVIIQDADLEYNPNDYPKLLKPILDRKTDVVYGSRFIKQHRPKYFFYYLGNILLSIATTMLYGRNVSDMETCYKVFRTSIIKSLDIKADRFEFEPEVTVKLLKRGIKIVEVPVKYQCRDFEEGKKITWKDGVKALWFLVKHRFVD